MRIFSRLLLLFLLVSMVPLALFSYFNLQQDEETLRAEALGRVSTLADKKMIQVKSYLTERERNVRFLAQSPRVVADIELLSDEYGARAGGVYLREDARVRQYFDRYVDESGVFRNIYLITPQGEIIYAQKHESDFATNLQNGPWRATPLADAFRDAVSTLEPMISRQDFYLPSKAPSIFITSPVIADGKFIGVLAAQLGNDLFNKVASDSGGLGASGEAVFARKDGEDMLMTTPLRYRPGGREILRLNLEKNKEIPMVGALFGTSGEAVKKDYRDKEVVSAWRHLPELDWGMVVKLDGDEVFASVYRQRTWVLEALLLMVCVSGLLAFLFARQISRPLEVLAKTVGEMAEGNLDQRADESAFGELGLFARSFNRMTGRLQRLYQTLEARIEERTRELSASNEQLQEEIVEREHIESALRDNQAELQRKQEMLIETEKLGRIGSWEMDAVSGEMRCSDEICRMFEFDPAQLLPVRDKFLQTIHPDDRMWVSQTCRQTKEACHDAEYRLNMADGRIKWVRQHCKNYLDATGRLLRTVGAVQDITASRRAEDNLRIAAVAFETQEGIMITDAEANIIRVNHAFEAITGYSPEDVLRKNPRILSSGKHDKAFYEEMWRQLTTAGIWSGEIWDKRKNGTIYPKWMAISEVKDPTGRVTEYVATFSDITQRKQAEEEIRNLAFYDGLTGLPNRRLLLDRCHLALAASQRSRQYGALLFLDMDRFKTLNDTLGHEYGDRMLVEVARRMQACVRESDTVARLGGDEFVVLLEDVDEQSAVASQKVAQIAEKIRASLSVSYQLAEHEHLSSPSIGVSLYRGNEEPVEVLLKYADMAMYQAKDAGRNAVRFFDPGMQLAVESRAALEADLRRAVPEGQLHLYYQIQVNNEHRVLGAEALVRWIHPLRGMVPPAQFIPVAEESALILEIGGWVMETACRQLAEWRIHALTRNLSIAVNVSAQQFKLHDFVNRVESILRTCDVDPSLLKLELTESVVLSDLADVVAKMHALRALGVKLSLDDFGTGYSSLAYLKQLPLDQLKIDQSFVRDIVTDPNDAVMVQTIIDMALNFKLNVIAEGVESEEQLSFLKLHGCMAYQGYLFSRPVPVEEFEALLVQQSGLYKALSS